MKTAPSRIYNVHNFRDIPELARLSKETLENIGIVGRVLPFRVNSHVTSNLIDWADPENDPMFRLVFPHRDMLPEYDFERLAKSVRFGTEKETQSIITEIHQQLNPHPDSQDLNVPTLDGKQIYGLQHKYPETLLFFPSEGQFCHSFCTYCFRWAQFTGKHELRFESKGSADLARYLGEHPEVTDVLLTGGDPVVMSTKKLRAYIEPLLHPQFSHLKNIRIGTKSLTFYPQRYLTDEDADDLMRLFEQVAKGGKSLALMAHFSHWKGFESDLSVQAIRRIRSAGAVIRSQAPVLRHINDDPQVWVRMWESQVRLGVNPYYMFVPRGTGASRYFSLPIARAYEIYREAISRVSGLARTARGPVMSTSDGKVEVQGVLEVGGNRQFVLRFLQARKPELCYKPFLADYSATATWFDDLKVSV